MPYSGGSRKKQLQRESPLAPSHFDASQEAGVEVSGGFGFKWSARVGRALGIGLCERRAELRELRELRERCAGLRSLM